jgi:hypothetical protein
MSDPNLLTDTERGPSQGLQTLQEKRREIQKTSNPDSASQYTLAELFYLHETPPSTRFQPTPGTARQIPHVSKIFTSSPVPLPATYRLPRRHHYQLPAINTNTSTTPYIPYSRNKEEAITHQRKDSGYESCAYMFMGIPDQNEEEEDGDGNDIDAWCNAVLAHTPLTAPNRYTYSLLRPDAPDFYPLVNNSTTKNIMILLQRTLEKGDQTATDLEMKIDTPTSPTHPYPHQFTTNTSYAPRRQCSTHSSINLTRKP